jgi:hypothetical protein
MRRDRRVLSELCLFDRDLAAPGPYLRSSDLLEEAGRKRASSKGARRRANLPHLIIFICLRFFIYPGRALAIDPALRRAMQKQPETEVTGPVVNVIGGSPGYNTGARQPGGVGS